jgi:multiple sugar transport system substrate-binding protein/lactose/L-arabinose transport system substrate-binding protein
MTLAACTPQVVKETVVVEKVVKETVEVEKVVKEAVEVEKEVTRVVEKAGAPAELTGTVKMWAWNEFIAEYMTRGFMAKYPGVKAEHEIIQNYNDTFMASLVAGAGLPDAAWIDSHTYQKLARTGQLRPLGDLQVPYREDILGFMYDGGIWDGQQYGCPRRYASELLWYRKDRFEEVGIDAAALRTWDDFLTLGQLATGDGKYMSVYDESGFDYALQSMMFGKEGTGFFDSQDNIVVNSAENLANLEKWNEMIQSGVMRPVPYWQPDWYDAARNATLACIVMPYWYGNLFPDNFPDSAGQWGVLRIPSLKAGLDNASVWQGAMFWVIPQRAQNPDMGWKLIEYTSFDYQDTTMQESLDRELVLPAYTKFLDVDYFWSEFLLYFGENLRRPAHEYAQGAPVNYMAPEYNECVTAFVAEITKMRDGDLTPKQTLDNAFDEFNKLLQAR